MAQSLNDSITSFGPIAALTTKLQELPSLVVNIAKLEQAIKLQEDWSAIFNRDGVKSFHMADFENCLGEYVGWQDNEQAKFKRKQHIGSLTFLLNMRSLIYVGAGTLTDIFEAVVEKNLVDENKAKAGRSLCLFFQVCLIELSNWIQRSMPAEMVDVFFEDGTKLGSEVLQLYRDSGAIEKLRNKFKVSQIISLQKGSSIGILPADLVAYEFFKYAYNKRAYP